MKTESKPIRVSFDFDGTLSRPDVQAYAKELIERGFEVVVTTSRFDEEHKHLYTHNPTNEDLYEVTDEVGIKRENIYFTNMEDKIDHLHKGTLWHLDDDDYELEEIKMSKLVIQGVDVNKSDWIEDCEFFSTAAIMHEYLSMQKKQLTTKVMKITDLKENQVVHCKTHEEAKRVLKLAHEAGMKWRDGDSYIETDMWNYYHDKTCYKFTNGSFGTIPYFKSKGLEIISSEKITDNKAVMENMENKTEFFEERVMEVSNNNTDWYKRVVFGKKNDKYLAWDCATTIEHAKNEVEVATWDYAQEIDPFRELKEAYARGEVIQYRSEIRGGGWVDNPNPAWHPSYEYRIKPKSKYVPFTYEDAELFMNRVVIAKDKSCKAVITYSDSEGVLLHMAGRSYKYLFERFTFIDGSPCGKEVEE